MSSYGKGVEGRNYELLSRNLSGGAERKKGNNLRIASIQDGFETETARILLLRSFPKAGILSKFPRINYLSLFYNFSLHLLARPTNMRRFFRFAYRPTS
jgi:hypothetical protein